MIRHGAYDKAQSEQCQCMRRASRSPDLQSELRGRVRSTRGELGHHDHLPMSEGCHERRSLLNLMLRPHHVNRRRGIKEVGPPVAETRNSPPAPLIPSNNQHTMGTCFSCHHHEDVYIVGGQNYNGNNAGGGEWRRRIPHFPREHRAEPSYASSARSPPPTYYTGPDAGYSPHKIREWRWKTR